MSKFYSSLQHSSDLVLQKFGSDPLGIQIQVVRSFLALGTILTLVFNDSRTFVGSVAGSWQGSICNGLPSVGAFCQFPEHVDLLRWLLVFPCVLLFFGVLPAFSGLLHLYAAYTVSSNTLSVEGGDQITVNMSALILIASLTRLQLFGWREKRASGKSVRFIPANVAIWAAALQLAFVYFEAAVVKLAEDPWKEGTAMWYWVQNGGSGLYEGVEPIARELLAFPLLSLLVTWGTLVLELALCLGAVFTKSRNGRFLLLFLGVVFHLGIATVLGLSSFFLAMTGALILVFWKPRDAVPWTLFRIARKKPISNRSNTNSPELGIGAEV